MAMNALPQHCVQHSASPPIRRAARLSCPAAAAARRGRARAWTCVRAQQTTSTWTEELRGEQRVVRITGGSAVSEEPVRGGDSTVSQSAAESSHNAALVAMLRDFFLPPGFPYTVSEDYGRYALLTFPVHVTGWLHDSLATAALLNAVGLGPALAAAAPGAAPALTAAAKWILKDGLGAAGRLVVAGRVAGVLDASPRQWRLYGSMASLLGGALEIATTFAPPQAFLPLAAGGTALKACGKAVAAPSHAALMAHFATYPSSGGSADAGPRNLGALTAKEEVQEVAAQLTGLAVSVAVLTWLGPATSDSPTLVAACWAAAASSHFLLRCAALQGIRFKSLNARRAMTAAIAHAIQRTEAPATEWASIKALNANEPLLTPDWALPTHLHLGCGLGAAVSGAAEAHARTSSTGAAAADVDAFLTWSCTPGGPLADSPFLVTWHGREAWVVFTQAATPADALRAVWLATCLTAGAEASTASSCLTAQGREHLSACVADMGSRYPSFRDALEDQGWDTGPLLPSPSVAPRLVHVSPGSVNAAAAQDG